MKINLSENIKNLRKKRGMTQEQLSEVMGVSVGAVHKWETGLSTPEIGLIVRFADFFDTSVDVLLGYEMKNNHPEAMEKRLQEAFNEKNRAGLEDAETALAKYPNSFPIVYKAAELYFGFGFEDGNRTYLRRAAELWERSESLLAQNNNPEIGENEIRRAKALTLFRLGDTKKAVEDLIAGNDGGCHDHLIGILLSFFEKDTEAASNYLIRGLYSGINEIMNVAPGYVRLYVERKQYGKAEQFLDWVENMMRGLQKGNGPDYIDKNLAEYAVCKAYVQAAAGNREAAAETLKKAIRDAKRFDADPSFDISELRFVEIPGKVGAYDLFGDSSYAGVKEMVRLIDDKRLTKLWKEVSAE